MRSLPGVLSGFLVLSTFAGVSQADLPPQPTFSPDALRVPAPLPRTFFPAPPDLRQPIVYSVQDCRHLCVAEALVSGETVEHCFKRVHYWLYGLKRYFFEHQRYRLGNDVQFCLAGHEDVMRENQVPVPSYGCQRLEHRFALRVSAKEWHEECGGNPTAWWCESVPSRNYYAFVRPYFYGTCPSLVSPVSSTP